MIKLKKPIKEEYISVALYANETVVTTTKTTENKDENGKITGSTTETTTTVTVETKGFWETCAMILNSIFHKN